MLDVKAWVEATNPRTRWVLSRSVSRRDRLLRAHEPVAGVDSPDVT